MCFKSEEDYPQTSATSGKPIFLSLAQTHVPVQLKKRVRGISPEYEPAESCTFKYSKMCSGLQVCKHTYTSEYVSTHVYTLSRSSQ